MEEEDGDCTILKLDIENSGIQRGFLKLKTNVCEECEAVKLDTDHSLMITELWNFEDITEIDIVSANPTSKLGMCQGDCDDDGDCKTGYRCFKRYKGDEIPYGCFVGDADVSAWDVCIPKNGPYNFFYIRMRGFRVRYVSSNKGSAAGFFLDIPVDDDGPSDVIDEPDQFVVELDFTSKWVAALFVAVLALTVAAFVALCRRMTGQSTKVAAYSKVDYVSETEA